MTGRMFNKGRARRNEDKNTPLTSLCKAEREREKGEDTRRRTLGVRGGDYKINRGIEVGQRFHDGVNVRARTENHALHF